MNNFSVLIGGKAGDGINQASLTIARIINQLGYRINVYYDYPSLIRGGHNFSIIRASKNKIAVHRDKIDCLLALNQETLDSHKSKLNDNAFIIYNSDEIKSEGLGIPLDTIIKEEKASFVMRNSCLIGAFCKSMGIKYKTLEAVFKKHITKETELNLEIALKGYNAAKELTQIEPLNQTALPILTGGEAVGLGLVKGGLKAYLAYPMTPVSNLLHYLAGLADELNLKVIHPENEIAVMLMSLGFTYAGQRVAVGTSGGGFCLMTEGLSLSGMAELPITIVMGQRPGPSTGMPTYSAQSDLHFILNAGQGEFPRFIVAPGDAEESYAWSAFALDISWKYQMPSFIMVDKTLSEGTFNFDIAALDELKRPETVLWDRQQPYKRYLNTETGISPLAFVPDKDAVIKVNSYEHEESGLTTEEPDSVKKMQLKRLRKDDCLKKEMAGYETVKVYGNKNSSTALLCWGSNKGVCVEAAEIFGLKVIHVLVLSPFPEKQLRESFSKVDRIICVENNATAQLVRLINSYGFKADKKILKYDGRSFSLDELETKLRQVL
ncbi:MAG: 2-oxoacid:acceptor oxidoreductase subunit alpha [Planctomycetota bacterium]